MSTFLMTFELWECHLEDSHGIRVFANQNIIWNKECNQILSKESFRLPRNQIIMKFIFRFGQ